MSCAVGQDVKLASKIIREGGLVAFATETVYGLGANALDPVAVARIFEAKQRPRFDPLICHLSSLNEISQLASNVPEQALQLAEKFWPGPLTLILPKKDNVPDLVTSGLGTVGVRVPDHEMARSLIESAGVPIAAPSANLFGKVSPTTAEHVAEQLGERIDYILDGGPSRIGLESTVVDCTGSQVKVLRPGGLTIEELESVTGPVEILQSTDHPQEQNQISPGLLPKHYAPGTKLILDPNATRPGNFKRVGLLSLGEIPHSDQFDEVVVLSEKNDLREAATGFFASLRKLDAANLDCIVAVPFPENGLGLALNDRLKRASAGS